MFLSASRSVGVCLAVLAEEIVHEARAGGEDVFLVHVGVGTEPTRLVRQLGRHVGKLLRLDPAVPRHVEHVERRVDKTYRSGEQGDEEGVVIVSQQALKPSALYWL